VNDDIGAFLETPFQEIPSLKRAAFTGGVKPRDRIGHFRVLEQIGEGGWGVVFLAEQEKPIRRRVALKMDEGRSAHHALCEPKTRLSQSPTGRALRGQKLEAGRRNQAAACTEKSATFSWIATNIY
jgi:hypothetical protein